MFRKIAVVASTLLLAFVILFISIFRAAAVRYEFAGSPKLDLNILGESEGVVNYYLPFPGNVLSDSPLWPVKAIRDRMWLALTQNEGKKADLKLLFADKRLGSAKILFEKGNPEEGLSTLTKAEKYLEEASSQEVENRKEGMDTIEFLIRISLASLKHYEVIQRIITLAPAEAKPVVIETQKYSQKVYETSRNALLEKGEIPPENPFGW